MSRPPLHLVRAAVLAGVLAAVVAVALVIVPTGLAAAAVTAPDPAVTSSDPAVTSSDLVVTSSDPALMSSDPAVARAWQWVLGQRGTGKPLTSTSTLSPAKGYPTTWTGAVSGTFRVAGVTPPPVVDPAVLTVTGPGTVSTTYAEPVSGRVNVPVSPGRWIVQAYKDTSTGRTQVPLQARVADDGTFTIDLGAVADPPQGSWALGLLDATAAYAPTGTAWPATPVYRGWEIQESVVTDTLYPVTSQPARADGTFAFAASAPGSKVFRIVDTASGAVVAESAPDDGLVRSFRGGTRSWSYDQALALLAGIAIGAPDNDLAGLTRGLLTMQRSGGFIESADVRNPAAGDAVFRTGISAVATYALLRRVQTMDPASPTYATTKAAAARGVTWLTARQRSDGLLGAGTGDRAADGTVDAAANPAWVSTEHNIDAWQTLHLASTVLTDSTASTAAARLATAIVGSLWDSASGRFLQGLTPTGAPDRTDPLDVSSWGSLFLRSVGRADLAATAVAHLAAFASNGGGTTGYRAYHPEPAFPAAPSNVWVEGTAGVALAQLRAGLTADHAATVAAVAALQEPDGSFPAATTTDDPTGMTDRSAVAAAAWFVLASVAPAGASIWD